MDKYEQTKFYWEIDVPIFKNNVILKDLGIALGIPFGLLILILFIASGGDISASGIKYPLTLIGLLFIAGFLFIMVVYGGRYSAGYLIDKNGILNYTQRKQAKKNLIKLIAHYHRAVFKKALCSRCRIAGSNKAIGIYSMEKYKQSKGVSQIEIYSCQRGFCGKNRFVLQ